MDVITSHVSPGVSWQLMTDLKWWSPLEAKLGVDIYQCRKLPKQVLFFPLEDWFDVGRFLWDQKPHARL